MNIVKIGLLDSKYNILEILVNGLKIYKNEYKLLHLIVLSIRSYVDLEEECPMIDYSIPNNFMNLGLLEELYTLVNYSSPIREQVESLIDEIEGFKI